MSTPEVKLDFESIFGKSTQGQTPALGSACEEPCYDPDPSCEACFEKGDDIKVTAVRQEVKI